MILKSMTAVPMVLAAISGLSLRPGCEIDLAPVIAPREALRNDPRDQAEIKQYSPVHLDCRLENGSEIFRITQMNRRGEAIKIKIVYDHDVVARVIEEQATLDHRFSVTKDITRGSDTPPGDLAYLDEKSGEYATLKGLYCEASEEMRRILDSAMDSTRDDICGDRNMR